MIKALNGIPKLIELEDTWSIKYVIEVSTSL